MKYIELKKELKQLAKELRYWKNNRKMDRLIALDLYQHEVQSKIDWRKDEFRHKHIAYCMLRGREYEQVERYCRKLPDFDRIKRIMRDYEQKVVCASA
jgi:hypothetical protein